MHTKGLELELKKVLAKVEYKEFKDCLRAHTEWIGSILFEDRHYDLSLVLLDEHIDEHELGTFIKTVAEVTIGGTTVVNKQYAIFQNGTVQNCTE